MNPRTLPASRVLTRELMTLFRAGQSYRANPATRSLLLRGVQSSAWLAGFDNPTGVFTLDAVFERYPVDGKHARGNRDFAEVAS